MKVYVLYRIAGSRMKFKESDSGNELHYARFPGIEFDEVGEWSEEVYREWFFSVHPKPVDFRQATRF